MRAGILAKNLFSILFLVVVLGPLLLLAFQLGKDLCAGHSNWLWLMVPKGRRLDLLVRSVTLAAGVGIGSGVLGSVFAIALLHFRCSIPAGLWCAVIMIAIPPYVHTLAWTSILSSIQVPLNLVQTASSPVQGWLLSWWIQLISFLPVAIGLNVIGLMSLDPSWVDAARVMRSDLQGVLRVVVPLSKPFIFAGGGFAFMLSLTDYSVPSLFHLNVYSLEIFAEFSASNEVSRALLSAAPLMAITVVVLSASQVPLRKAFLAAPRQKMDARRHSADMAAGSRVLRHLCISALLVLAAVPPLTMAVSAGDWSRLSDALYMARREIFCTTWVAVVAAALVLPLGYAAAAQLAREDRRGKLWWTLVTAPVAVPPALIGIGLVYLWNHAALDEIYQRESMLILAALARFAPFAAIAMYVSLRRMDPLLMDAARVFHTQPVRTWRVIYIPMLIPGFLAAGFITLALSAGELGASLIVAPPGKSTLTIRIYNYLHYGASETVAGLCLMMTVAAVAAASMAAWFLHIRKFDFARKRPVHP